MLVSQKKDFLGMSRIHNYIVWKEEVGFWINYWEWWIINCVGSFENDTRLNTSISKLNNNQKTNSDCTTRLSLSDVAGSVGFACHNVVDCLWGRSPVKYHRQVHQECTEMEKHMFRHLNLVIGVPLPPNCLLPCHCVSCNALFPFISSVS